MLSNKAKHVKYFWVCVKNQVLKSKFCLIFQTESSLNTHYPAPIAAIINW